MATTHIRVYAMSSFDTIPPIRSLEFDAYIDDTSISCTGTRQHVVASLGSATAALHRAITAPDMMSCQLSLDEVCAVASCKSLGRDLASALGQLGARVTDST
eukprot:4531486-Pyramimonas_sp.AAC.1